MKSGVPYRCCYGNFNSWELDYYSFFQIYGTKWFVQVVSQELAGQDEWLFSAYVVEEFGSRKLPLAAQVKHRTAFQMLTFRHDLQPSEQPENKTGIFFFRFRANVQPAFKSQKSAQGWYLHLSNVTLARDRHPMTSTKNKNVVKI